MIDPNDFRIRSPQINPAPPMMAPPQRLGILQRLFGLPAGASPNGALMGGVMAAQQMDPGGRRGLIPALTRFIGGARAAGQQTSARDMQQRLLAGGATPETVMGLLAGGNPEAARVVSGLLPGAGATPQFTFVNEGEGGRTGVLNARTGAVEWQRPAAQQSSTQQMPVRVQGMALDEMNRFNTRASPLFNAANSYASATALAERIRANPREAGPASMGLLYSFIRQLDPGSVVREGEVGLVSGASGAWTQLENMLARWQRGGFSVAMVDGIMNAARDLDQANQRAYDLLYRNASTSFRSVTGFELPRQDTPYATRATASPTGGVQQPQQGPPRLAPGALRSPESPWYPTLTPRPRG